MCVQLSSNTHAGCFYSWSTSCVPGSDAAPVRIVPQVITDAASVALRSRRFFSQQQSPPRPWQAVEEPPQSPKLRSVFPTQHIPRWEGNEGCNAAEGIGLPARKATFLGLPGRLQQPPASDRHPWSGGKAENQPLATGSFLQRELAGRRQPGDRAEAAA